MRRKTGYNSRFAKAGVLCFYDSEVLNSGFVHLIKFSAENPRLRKAAKRWEKSPFGTIFPNDRSATPTVGKPSLLPHDVLPTVAFDAFQFGTSSS
jgi:hypothetical protein